MRDWKTAIASLTIFINLGCRFQMYKYILPFFSFVCWRVDIKIFILIWILTSQMLKKSSIIYYHHIAISFFFLFPFRFSLSNVQKCYYFSSFLVLLMTRPWGTVKVSPPLWPHPALHRWPRLDPHTPRTIQRGVTSTSPCLFAHPCPALPCPECVCVCVCVGVRECICIRALTCVCVCVW